jgi:hypothetical protein
MRKKQQTKGSEAKSQKGCGWGHRVERVKGTPHLTHGRMQELLDIVA